MSFLKASKFRLRRPKWVIANLVETTQTAPDNALKGYDRMKGSKKEQVKRIRNELAPSIRDEHSCSTANTSKVQRDIFGATILPSNLSFDSMKKLSMNQIKLEDIPLVDENEAAEALVEEKLNRMKEAEAGKRQATKGSMKNKEVIVDFPFKENDNLRVYVDVSKADPFEKIPGPRLLETITTALSDTTRHVAAYFLMRLLRTGSAGPFKKYGPIVRLPDIVGGRILLINRAEHISAVYEQDMPDPTSSCLETLECSRLRRHGERKDGRIISGLEWEEKRKNIDKILLKEEEKYFDNLEENGNNLVRRIRDVKNRANEVPKDFVNEVNKWSLECLLQILFDRTFGFLNPDDMQWPSKNMQLLEALKEATRTLIICDSGFQLWRFMSTSASACLDNSCHTIETILSDYVNQAQMNLHKKDETSHGEPLTYAEGLLLHDCLTRMDVVTGLLDILLIGMNAMTSALSFLLYHIARNPRAQKELFTEIKQILPEKYSRLEHEHLSSLRYMPSCLKESLRLKMPLPILTKQLKRDVILSNFHIPRGTLVLMAAQLEALKEENFDDPQEFRPERWLDNESRHPFTELPLSVYPKSSFKSRMAEMSVMTCAAQIIRNFTVEYNYGNLSAINSTISYPVAPLKFSFFDRAH